MVDDFDGSAQLNILKWLGKALEAENLGSATSYAILNADTPPMLAGDNIGKLPEESNTAPGLRNIGSMATPKKFSGFS